jgi:hypothetical protein
LREELNVYLVTKLIKFLERDLVIPPIPTSFASNVAPFPNILEAKSGELQMHGRRGLELNDDKIHSYGSPFRTINLLPVKKKLILYCSVKRTVVVRNT